MVWKCGEDGVGERCRFSMIIFTGSATGLCEAFGGMHRIAPRKAMRVLTMYVTKSVSVPSRQSVQRLRRTKRGRGRLGSRRLSGVCKRFGPRSPHFQRVLSSQSLLCVSKLRYKSLITRLGSGVTKDCIIFTGTKVHFSPGSDTRVEHYFRRRGESIILAGVHKGKGVCIQRRGGCYGHFARGAALSGGMCLLRRLCATCAFTTSRIG